MIIPMLCVTIFVVLVVWFLVPMVARLMIHTPTSISICVCLSMVQVMAVFISMRCTLCGHFLQVALTLILVVFFQAEDGIRDLTVTGVQTCALPISTNSCVAIIGYVYITWVGISTDGHQCCCHERKRRNFNYILNFHKLISFC